MIQRMLRREIHASALIDNGRLQRLSSSIRYLTACLGPAARSAMITGFSCRNQIARARLPRLNRPEGRISSVEAGAVMSLASMGSL